MIDFHIDFSMKSLNILFVLLFSFTFCGSLRCGGGGVFSWIGVIVFMFSN